MSKIPGSAHAALSFGGLTILGGAYGYFRKGSKASLGAGGLCGGLLILSGVMISGDSQFEGHALAACTSGMMGVGLGQRFVKSGKFMPSGLVAFLGLASASYHVKKAMEWKD
mmetsp:Transcript_6150/g.8896  ORF Transcript_6150/g.8896 Transcript_6150/m.8896 type:complete len:112 (+) Transcript_6150:135-470(+)